MKKKFNINDYKGDYVMHCDTEEKANVFCKYLDSVGKKWNNGWSYLKTNAWDNYEEDICYSFNYGGFCRYNWCCNDYTILEFDNFDWSEKEKENNMKNFTKSDLQNGMVVETREEERYMVVGDKFIHNNGFMRIKTYQENLKYMSDNDFDIIKVYDRVTSFDQMKYLENLTLLWERKDEMETKEYIIEQPYIDEDGEDSPTIIKIYPNNLEGYHKSEANCPIVLEYDEYYGFGLTVDSAKEVIKALQEIVDYMEEK